MKVLLAIYAVIEVEDMEAAEEYAKAADTTVRDNWVATLDSHGIEPGREAEASKAFRYLGATVHAFPSDEEQEAA